MRGRGGSTPFWPLGRGSGRKSEIESPGRWGEVGRFCPSGFAMISGNHEDVLNRKFAGVREGEER